MLLRNFYYFTFLTFLFAIIDLTNGQQLDCTIAGAVLDPGKSTISQQSNSGFCKEWIVGPVTKPQRIMISFTVVDVNCDKNDTLTISNEDRTYVLYDYCLHKKNDSKMINFVMTKAKYMLARLRTTSSRLLTATFDVLLIDGQYSSTLAPPSSPITLTQKQPEKTSPVLYSDYDDDCPQFPKEMTDIYGSIIFPGVRRSHDNSLRNSNCSWIIKAPVKQRVYLIFDYINLPNDVNEDLEEDDTKCTSNYIAISSQNRPNESYKLCGQRRGVKIITTYNNVLINFVVDSIIELAVGFSLIFRVISDPSALIPSTTVVSDTITSTSTPLMPKFDCGNPSIKPNDTGISGRIIGGTESIPHSWPWQVMISDGSIMCGASLVHPSWIVTAAHCTESFNGQIKAYLGMHNRLRTETSKMVKIVSRTVVHPNYMGRLTQWDYDIALMKLQDPVTLNNEISPICLPPQGVNMAPLGSKGFVTGWGDTQGTGYSYILRQATITVKENPECGASSPNMLCAGDKSPLHDSCQGDSGGPFTIKSNNNYYLVGIVSWGYECNGAGVYTKVSNFVDWINEMIQTY